MSRQRRSTSGRSPRPKPRPHYTLHIVSDATGTLASHLIASILTQFPSVRFTKVFHTFQQTAEDIDATIATFARGKHIVLHSLVDPEGKLRIREACVKLKIPHYDLTGSLVQFISDHTGVLPVNELSRLHQVDAGYFRRIEAMEFTAQHDDSRGLETVQLADIVLVGLSRVSKTPTSTFLGSQGYKVANISVTPQTGFPRELGRVKRKVVALTIQPQALVAIRQQRSAEFGIAESGYADRRTVLEEILWAEGEYRRRGYPVVDTTGMTIERVAATVLKIKRFRHKGLMYL